MSVREPSRQPDERRSPRIFTLEINGRPTLVFEAMGLAEASEICLDAAQGFPPKPKILNQITVSLIGDRVQREGPPRPQTTTLTSGSRYSSTSTTFDSTPVLRQNLRINNRSIYDIKNVVVECRLLSESGEVLGVKSQVLPYRFYTARARVLTLREPATAPDAVDISCSATDFEYIGVGIPPKPESAESRADPSIANGTARRVVDEWGMGRKLY
jgi:hypothetical protein